MLRILILVRLCVGCCTCCRVVNIGRGQIRMAQLVATGEYWYTHICTFDLSVVHIQVLRDTFHP